MKARGKMEEDKLEITMADSDLMQQDHRTALLADQVDHSMLGDHQETPMEDGLVEEADLEMVIMEADRHPMPLEQEDPALVSADLHPLLVVVVVVSRRPGEGSSSARESPPSPGPARPGRPCWGSWPRPRTTGTPGPGRSSAQAASEASTRPSGRRCVRGRDCSDTPRTAHSSMSVTGTSGLRSSLSTSSLVQWPWQSDSMMSPSLPVTGPS